MLARKGHEATALFQSHKIGISLGNFAFRFLASAGISDKWVGAWQEDQLDLLTRDQRSLIQTFQSKNVYATRFVSGSNRPPVCGNRTAQHGPIGGECGDTLPGFGIPDA